MDSTRLERPDTDEILARLQDVFATRLGGDGRVEVLDVISGNMNSIYKVRYAGQTLGVRITFDQYRFKYERDIIKEIFAIFIIYHARAAANDEVARTIVDGILRAPSGAHISHRLVRSVVYYDWSRHRLPYPFFIFEWVEGDVLWRAGDAGQYFLAGQDLARLHRIAFESYYRDIFQIGRAPLGWAENFARAFGQELAEAEQRLPARLAAKARALDIGRIRPARPCLVHNDYAGGNIIVAPDGGRKIIDWDNWLVEAPELDLVKMKYWTAIGEDGMLGHDPALYGAFLDGYRSLAGTAIDEARMRAYEMLWLMRTFNFESAKRDEAEEPAAGVSWGKHYPPPSVYLDHLRAL